MAATSKGNVREAILVAAKEAAMAYGYGGLNFRDLAETVCRVVGFEGELVFDATKPDGTPRKLLDVSKLEQMGWKATIALEDGIRATYADFLEHHAASSQMAVAE